MKRTIAYALAGVLLASSAHAATLPPLEYDHPYAGRLDVIVAENAEQIRIGCPTTGGGSLGLACALRYEDHCTIVRRPEADIVRAGYTLNEVTRHEIGHCNGWAQDHAGARWEEVKPTPRARPASRTVVAAASPQYRAHPCPVISLLTLGVLCF